VRKEDVCLLQSCNWLLAFEGFCVCHRWAFANRSAFAIEGPLPLKGHCHWRAIAIEGPLASMRHCHPRAFGFKAPCLCLRGVFFLSSQHSTYNASNYSNRCNILRPRLSGNATSTDQAVPRLEWLWEKRMFACYSGAIDSLPWKTSAFAVEGRLPSMGLCDRSAFGIEGPLPSKDLYHRCAIAMQGPLA
jgi:hypothetical protein